MEGDLLGLGVDVVSLRRFLGVLGEVLSGELFVVLLELLGVLADVLECGVVVEVLYELFALDHVELRHLGDHFGRGEAIDPADELDLPEDLVGADVGDELFERGGSILDLHVVMHLSELHLPLEQEVYEFRLIVLIVDDIALPQLQ